MELTKIDRMNARASRIGLGTWAVGKMMWRCRTMSAEMSAAPELRVGVVGLGKMGSAFARELARAQLPGRGVGPVASSGDGTSQRRRDTSRDSGIHDRSGRLRRYDALG